jgi:predicted dehydrogenase
VRLGIIGTGGMGTGHAQAFLDLKAKGKEVVEMVALADPWKANLANCQSKCKELQPSIDVAAYSDHKELLKRADVQGVVIASPEHWHAQHAIDAIEAGKDVYLEKPMTLRLEDALRLLDCVKAHPQQIAQVGTQMTRLPKYHEARKLIKSGAIGTPTISQTSYCRNSKNGEWNYYKVDESWKPGVDVDWDAWCGPLGKQAWDPYLLNRWRRYRIASTGIIGDLLVHVMTPLIFAIDQGWPVKVTAIGQHIVDKKMENHDTLHLVAEFETGHILTVMGATTNEQGLETVIRGHEGTIRLGGNNCTMTPESLFAEEKDPIEVKCADIGNDQDVHRLGWLHSVRTRTAPVSNVELGTKVMVIVDLATRSMWEGGAWSYDPATRRVARA